MMSLYCNNVLIMDEHMLRQIHLPVSYKLVLCFSVGVYVEIETCGVLLSMSVCVCIV